MFWPILIAVACGSFMLGVQVESYHWRRRCNDTLAAMEAMKNAATSKTQNPK